MGACHPPALGGGGLGGTMFWASPFGVKKIVSDSPKPCVRSSHSASLPRGLADTDQAEAPPPTPPQKTGEHTNAGEHTNTGGGFHIGHQLTVVSLSSGLSRPPCGGRPLWMSGVGIPDQNKSGVLDVQRPELCPLTGGRWPKKASSDWGG